MIRILSCATSCYGKQISLESTLKDIASLGFTGVELMSIPFWFDHVLPEKYNLEKRQKIFSLLSDLNLSTPALSAHCELGKAEGGEQLSNRIKLAASLGIKLVLTGGGNLQGSDESGIFHESLAKAIAVAEEEGIVLLLETGGPVLSSGVKVKKVIEQYNSQFLQIAYDPANVALWGSVDPATDIFEVLGNIKHVHIKEYKPGCTWHPPLGEGQIDFNSLFALLKEANYSGSFSIEIDLKDGRFETAHTNLRQSLLYLHQKTNFDECFGNDE